MSVYQRLFANKIKNNFDKAQTYIGGIVLSDLNNIERISETLDASYYQLQHFISDSKWDAGAVIDQVAQEVNSIVHSQSLTGLLIDESGWEKKGSKSVGVGHHIRLCRSRRTLWKRYDLYQRS
ncbi:MAG: transposase [Bacteroidales bacterium]